MNRSAWKKLLVLGLLGGSVLLQAPACVETAVFATAASSAITAGGVLYLVSRVLSD